MTPHNMVQVKHFQLIRSLLSKNQTAAYAVIPQGDYFFFLADALAY